MLFLGFGTLLGSLISAAVVQRLGPSYAVAAGTALLVLLYTGSPHVANLPAVTVLYLIVFTTLGILFPIVMEALTSLNASIRGTISSLANSTMNAANTIEAWAAGILYAEFGGYSTIGLFSAVCLALSLGIFQFGGVFRRKTAKAGQGSASAT
jgi:predicted MFS family arabinose efflux permease